MSAATVNGTTPEQELQQSLDAMEGGSKLPFAQGLRNAIGNKARQKFIDNHHEWPTHKDKVLRAAREIGALAAALAYLDAEMNDTPATQVEELHANVSIQAVKQICDARRLRFKWCPEP